MPYNQQINGVKVKQVIMLVVIFSLLGIITYHLRQFIPSFLGAITLYIICRNYYFKLINVKKWYPWIAAFYVMFITLAVISIPAYFVGDAIASRVVHASDYIDTFNNFFDKVHKFIYSELGIDLLSAKNIEKIGGYIAEISSTVVSATVDIIVAIGATYFILFFMFINAHEFEATLKASFPLKKSNIKLIADKTRKLVVANAVGIPVVAFIQGIVGLLGYWVFEAPDPWFLFALTCVGSMLPIVGASIVYIPVSIFMMATGNWFGGVGVLLYGVVIIGAADNLFRFIFLKKIENIHPLNTVFGIILGLHVFGMMGLIFGPILISLTSLFIKVYKNEFSDINDHLISYQESEKPD